MVDIKLVTVLFRERHSNTGPSVATGVFVVKFNKSSTDYGYDHLMCSVSLLMSFTEEVQF